jgi:hypothetical protein
MSEREGESQKERERERGQNNYSRYLENCASNYDCYDVRRLNIRMNEIMESRKMCMANSSCNTLTTN